MCFQQVLNHYYIYDSLYLWFLQQASKKNLIYEKEEEKRFNTYDYLSVNNLYQTTWGNQTCNLSLSRLLAFLLHDRADTFVHLRIITFRLLFCSKHNKRNSMSSREHILKLKVEAVLSLFTFFSKQRLDDNVHCGDSANEIRDRVSVVFNSLVVVQNFPCAYQLHLFHCPRSIFLF